MVLDAHQARTQTRAQLRAEPEHRIELSDSELNSKPSSGSDLSPEPKFRRGSRTRMSTQPRTELQAISDPIIEQAKKATQKAPVLMIRKYTKKHDI
jgi:hypothetical protein